MRQRLGDRQVEEGVALAEDDQPVAGLLDVRDHVRREKGGVAFRVDGVDEDVEELASSQRVEAREGLVEQEDPRSCAQGERQPDLGLLAAGQLGRQRRQRDREPLDVVGGKTRVEPVAEGRREGDVLGDRQVAVERWRLRHIPDPRDRSLAIRPRIDAAGRQPAFGRALEADPRPDQGRLAGAVRPDQRRDAALGHLEIDAAQRPVLAPIAFAEAVGLEDRRHPSLLGSCRPDRRFVADCTCDRGAPAGEACRRSPPQSERRPHETCRAHRPVPATRSPAVTPRRAVAGQPGTVARRPSASVGPC